MRYHPCCPILCLLLLLNACSTTPKVTAPTPPKAQTTVPTAATPASVAWELQKEAVSLHIKADPQLNLFNKAPHTLMLCVYQLRDATWFNQLQSERNGLQKLLECGKGDSSIVHARRMVIQPGQEINELLEAHDDVKFINIAAGYYSMKKDGATRSFPIPLYAERRGDTIVQTPQKLSIDLSLGPKEIRKNEKK